VTAGVPGAGIGGLFYLACALLMPMRALLGVARGTPRTYGAMFVARHAAMATAMLGSIWVAGWLLGLALGWWSAGQPPAHGTATAADTPRVIGQAMVALTVGTLITVLLLVECLRLIVPRGPRRPAGRHDERG
jgi:hypothetical protein